MVGCSVAAVLYGRVFCCSSFIGYGVLLQQSYIVWCSAATVLYVRVFCGSNVIW